MQLECQFLSVYPLQISTNDFWVFCKFVCPSFTIIKNFKTPPRAVKKIHHFYSFLSFIYYHRIRIPTLKSLYRQLDDEYRALTINDLCLTGYVKCLHEWLTRVLSRAANSERLHFIKFIFADCRCIMYGST